MLLTNTMKELGNTVNNLRKLLNKEFLKRVLSVFIFVPIVIIPIIYSNYLLIIVYILFNSIILYELNNLKSNDINILFINSSMVVATLSFILFILIIITNPIDKIKIIEIIITIWLFDTFSYVGGNLIGGKKLIPKISSGKTISGLLTGMITTLIILQSYNYYYIGFEYINLIITVGVIILSFLGDIFASIIKRMASVKDSSNLLPGHGGFYDRFDSFIGVFFVFGLIILFS